MASQYGRSPVQDATEALDAIDRVNGSTWSDSSRARAFSSDRRTSLGLIEQHRPTDTRCPPCPRCGGPQYSHHAGTWCDQCERDRAEWTRIERKAAGLDDAPGIGWSGLAVACLLWALFLVVLGVATYRAVLP